MTVAKIAPAEAGIPSSSQPRRSRGILDRQLLIRGDIPARKERQMVSRSLVRGGVRQDRHDSAVWIARVVDEAHQRAAVETVNRKEGNSVLGGWLVVAFVQFFGCGLHVGSAEMVQVEDVGGVFVGAAAAPDEVAVVDVDEGALLDGNGTADS